MKKGCKTLFLIVLLLFFGLPAILSAYDYRPELSGNLEEGDWIYTEAVEEDGEEIILDQYRYQRYWLKYRQKIDKDDYYYLKFQYYQKNYQEQQIYDNISRDLWGNYTYRLTPSVKNRWEFNFKNKTYLISPEKSYQSLRIKYELNFALNSRHKYNFYLQRQWNQYEIDFSKDFKRDRLSLNWNYKVNPSLKINSTLQLEEQRYQYPAESSNKYGQKMSVGFNYQL